MMRPMFLEFSDDRNTYTVDTQFMLGPNLLVAPVFSEEGEVSFYVPEEGKGGEEGEWVSYFSHTKKYKPGKWYTETHDFDSLPLLIRPGSVTAVNFKIEKPDAEDLMEGLELIVNGPLEGGKQDVLVMDTKNVGKVKKTLTVEMKGDEVVVSEEGVKVTVV